MQQLPDPRLQQRRLHLRRRHWRTDVEPHPIEHAPPERPHHGAALLDAAPPGPTPEGPTWLEGWETTVWPVLSPLRKEFDKTYLYNVTGSCAYRTDKTGCLRKNGKMVADFHEMMTGTPAIGVELMLLDDEDRPVPRDGVSIGKALTERKVVFTAAALVAIALDQDLGRGVLAQVLGVRLDQRAVVGDAVVVGLPFWETPWFTATPGMPELVRQGGFGRMVALHGDQGEKLGIIFSDNGIGIPSAYREKIFEKFFRVPHGDTHNVKGYGLGLSYVSQIIQQHHGM